MGSAERRAREKEELRRAILDAARDLFAESGYEAVSMRRIAERIEYSPTAIYLYFKDKDEILAHLVAEGFQMLHGALDVLHAEIGDPVERLRVGGHRYAQFALENRNYYTLMFQLSDGGATGAFERSAEVGHLAFAFIRRCVAEGQGAGAFRRDVPEILLSHVIWASIHGAVALELAHRLRKLPEEARPLLFPAVCENALRGLMPRSDAERH